MDVVSAVVALATEIFKLINTETTRKYIDRAVKLELAIQEEESKPYDQQDDARIVELKKEAVVIANAAKSELDLWKAKK